MPELIPWFLFLHVMGAIIAFGPSFAFPIIGAMGAADRPHANFATRVSLAISRKRTVPAALSMPVTGIGLISGTSADGIDAAVVDIWEEDGALKLEQRAAVCLPYPAAVDVWPTRTRRPQSVLADLVRRQRLVREQELPL